MQLVDLHTHTTASDGTYTPTELAAYAVEKQLTAIAITDHDTTAGIPEALNAAEGTSLTIIPGIELSCDYAGREIHILGYLLRPTDPLLLTRLTSLQQSRDARNQQMLLKLQSAGIHLTMEQLQNGNPATIVTRAHFARAMQEQGYIKKKDDAFRKYIGEHAPCYIPKPELSPATGIQYIREAGGLAVLAHPLLYQLGYAQLDTLIQELLPHNLSGIEVYHSSNNQYNSSRLRELARKYNLLPTGGSDFHGTNKQDIDLGCGRGRLRISALLLTDLLTRHKESMPH